jgi:hypothetical protein
MDAAAASFRREHRMTTIIRSFPWQCKITDAANRFRSRPGPRVELGYCDRDRPAGWSEPVPGGLAPAEVPAPFTAHCFNSFGRARVEYG